MKKAIVLFIGILFISILAACGETSHDPADISMDTDQCYTCHMGIEDVSAATQVILEDGTPRFFDDIGCMLMYFNDTTEDIAISYVVDQETGDWIDFDEAIFVHDNEQHTPMSYGFIAFGTDEDAENYIAGKENTEKLSSNEVQAITVTELEDWYRAHDAGHHEHGDNEDHG